MEQPLHYAEYKTILTSFRWRGFPSTPKKARVEGFRLLPDFVLNKSILSEQEQGEIRSALQGAFRCQNRGHQRSV